MQPFALQHPKKGKPLGQQPAVSRLVAGIFLSTQQDEAGTKCHHPDNSWLVTRLRKVNGEWSKLCVMFDLEFNFCSVLFMCTVYNCYFYLNIFLATLICLASLLHFLLLLSSTIDDASSSGNELYAEPICSSSLHVILMYLGWDPNHSYGLSKPADLIGWWE